MSRNPQAYAALVLDVLAVYNEKVEDEMLPIRECDMDAIDDVISSLTVRCALVIQMVYGLDDRPRSKSEIATVFGTSTSNVGQIKSIAMHKLAHPRYRSPFVHLFRSFLEAQVRSLSCYLADVKKEAAAERRRLWAEISRLRLCPEMQRQRVHHPDQVKLSELDFTVRAQNCFEQAGIKTIGDLVIRTETDLMGIRRMGRRTVLEIKDILERYGLSLAKA